MNTLQSARVFYFFPNFSMCERMPLLFVFIRTFPEGRISLKVLGVSFCGNYALILRFYRALRGASLQAMESALRAQ